MNRLLLCILVASVSAIGSLRADENVSALQTRLKAGGFYFGEINGRYDNNTAAAITRYQIRNGLQITGKLDAPTRHALGMAPGKAEVPLPASDEEAWRRLRKSDQEYIKRLMEEDASDTKPAKAAPVTTPRPATTGQYDRERLRDYVAAFILAGLDPHIGSEAEFFADRVNYFGEKGVTREKIQRDLQRYNDRWPQRGFRLAGDLEVATNNGKLKVSFPLRYELRNGSKHSAGKVWKTLVLEKAGSDDFQIILVDERKVK